MSWLFDCSRLVHRLTERIVWDHTAACWCWGCCVLDTVTMLCFDWILYRQGRFMLCSARCWHAADRCELWFTSRWNICNFRHIWQSTGSCTSHWLCCFCRALASEVTAAAQSKVHMKGRAALLHTWGEMGEHAEGGGGHRHDWAILLPCFCSSKRHLHFLFAGRFCNLRLCGCCWRSSASSRSGGGGDGADKFGYDVAQKVYAVGEVLQEERAQGDAEEDDVCDAEQRKIEE